MITGMTKKPQQSESRELDKYIVRFPDGMRDRIAEAARGNNRSMNAEIVARLEASFAEPPPLSAAARGEHEELLTRINKLLAQSHDQLMTDLQAKLEERLGKK